MKLAKKKKKPDNTKPVKVVYISNPMRVKVSASEFRALVQELTGQDAELPDPSKFNGHDSDATNSDDQTVVPDVDKMEEELDGDYHRISRELGAVGTVIGVEQTTETAEGEREPLDDVFSTQMLENLPGLLPSSYFLV